jgi:hypothetical protein
MKTVTMAALAITMSVGSAWAQDVIIAPERETVIREYIKKKPLASITLPGVELNLGSTLPETVEVHSFEGVPDVTYQYVVVDGRTVLVDPGTRKIIRVYD